MKSLGGFLSWILSKESKEDEVGPGYVVETRGGAPVEVEHVKEPDIAAPDSPEKRKVDRFETLLSDAVIDLDKLSEMSWMGFPEKDRARIWRLFLDYEPISVDQTETTLERKRNDYADCLNRLFSATQSELWTASQKQTLHQISIDLPRTSMAVLRDERVNLLFRHVLFVWAVRHPASGYVQGMNDILLPFFVVFVGERTGESPNVVAMRSELDNVSDKILAEIEADCFWCFGKLLDGIQDMFTRGQPGLYRMIERLQDLITGVLPELGTTMAQGNIRLSNFIVRWMNCLLVREFHITQLLAIWDTFMSDNSKIASMQVYICAAMLGTLAPSLVGLEEPEFVITIQSITPDFWTQTRVEVMLAQAFVYESTMPTKR